MPLPRKGTDGRKSLEQRVMMRKDAEAEKETNLKLLNSFGGDTDVNVGLTAGDLEGLSIDERFSRLQFASTNALTSSQNLQSKRSAAMQHALAHGYINCDNPFAPQHPRPCAVASISASDRKLNPGNSPFGHTISDNVSSLGYPSSRSSGTDVPSFHSEQTASSSGQLGSTLSMSDLLPLGSHPSQRTVEHATASAVMTDQPWCSVERDTAASFAPTGDIAYEIDVEAKLGEGANGTVFRATTRAGSAVAVKEFHGSAAALELQEAELNALRALRHPHLVALYGVERSTDCIRVVMELCSGPSLHALRPLDEADVRRAVREVLLAVAFMHQRGFVHRDIKAANVLLQKDADGGMHCKLADLGSVVQLGALESDLSGHVLSGVTAQWAAPELVREGLLTDRADVWSVGCVALELLSGRDPWAELHMGNMHEVLAHLRQCTQRPAYPPGLSGACVGFLDAALDPVHARRPTAAVLLMHPWLLEDQPVRVQHTGPALRYAGRGSVWAGCDSARPGRLPRFDAVSRVNFRRREELITEVNFSDHSTHTEQERICKSAGQLAGHTRFAARAEVSHTSSDCSASFTAAQARALKEGLEGDVSPFALGACGAMEAATMEEAYENDDDDGFVPFAPVPDM